MLFSIITVSYNSKEYIKETLTSLKEQSFKDYELIIIDGNSNDGSLEEFAIYKDWLPQFRIVSEKDSGIYDAMNKGVKLAEGDYIFFLNLGDKLYDYNILQNIADKIFEEQNFDIYYGDVLWGNEILVQPKKINKLFFLRERMICHQSIFARRPLLINIPFDLDLRVCADRDWLFNAIKAGASYKKLDIVIACYNLDGKSSNYKLYESDSLKTIRKEFGLLGVFFVKIKRLIGKRLKK